MSSSNQPYKSKLLNTINRYYIKLNSQVKTKFREISYGIKTTIETATLPLFWLWQSGQKIGNVFTGSQEKKTQNFLNKGEDNPNTETQNANHFSKKEKEVKKGAKTRRLNIEKANNLIFMVRHDLTIHPKFSSYLNSDFQALASRLDDRHLVIINNNKVGDIFPEHEQQDLSLFILETINKYETKSNNNFFSFIEKILKNILKNPEHKSDKETKYFQGNSTNQEKLLPAQEENSTNQLFTSNLNINDRNQLNITNNNKRQQTPKSKNNRTKISKLVNLVKNNQLSKFVKANIFPEEKQEPIEVKKIKTLGVLAPKKWLNFNKKNHPNNQKILRGKNKLSVKAIVPNNKPIIANLVEKPLQKIDKVLPKIKENTSAIVLNTIDKLITVNQTQNRSHQNENSNPFQIKKIVAEGINYILNQKKFARYLAPITKLQQTQIIMTDSQKSEPWLSWSDLYDRTGTPSPKDMIKTVMDHDTLNTNNNTIAITTDVENNEQNSLTTAIKNNEQLRSVSSVYAKKTMRAELNHQAIKAETEKTSLQKTTIKDKTSIGQNNPSDTIEVKVMEVKYEKHILEIILEILDGIILFLEETTIKIISLIKKIINIAILNND